LKKKRQNLLSPNEYLDARLSLSLSLSLSLEVKVPEWSFEAKARLFLIFWCLFFPREKKKKKENFCGNPKY